MIPVNEYPLEAVQGPRRGHAGHAGSVDRAELHLRHIEGDGGRLQPGFHDFQRTGQYGTDRAPTSGGETEMEKVGGDTANNRRSQWTQDHNETEF